jgi:carbamoyltransferase
MFLLRQSTHRMVVRHDPQIGHLFIPNLNVRIPNELGGYYVRTNALGFRSDIEFISTRSRRPRVLFFGDSLTAADGCSNAERFAELVGQALDAEVFNYGLSGSGTDQQLLIFEHFATGVEADLIVLGVYVENIERIKVAYREAIDRVTGQHRLVPKPYFTLENDGLRLHNVPVPIERPFVADVDAGRYQAIIPSKWRWMFRVLDIYRTHPKLEGLRRFNDKRLPGLRPMILRASGFQPHPDYKRPDSPGWLLLQAIIQRFVEHASPTPVLLLPIPTFFHFFDGVTPGYQKLFERLATRVSGLHVMDLTTPLRRRPRDDRRSLVFRDDKTHFSPHGHRVVAGLIAEEIRKRHLLPTPARPQQRSTASPSVNSEKATYILGLSCFYHDSAAALIKDGQIIAAAEEERFTRIKNDRRFPHFAANYCLEEAGIQQRDLAAVVYYDSASLTFERLLHTLAAVGPAAEDAWMRAMPSWVQYKLHLPQLIRRYLSFDGLVLQEIHHRSHAASAFYPSPYQRAAILTIDGVGEWATASIGVGSGSRIQLLKEMHFPHSLGLLYSAFTQFTGFKVNSGEYKMMGLAPYGEPKYVDTIYDNLVDLKSDGSLELNLDYFAYLSQPTMTNERFAKLFGGPARHPDDRITQREMDIARSVQVVTEEAMLRMARYAHHVTGERNLCLSGGVALNCVANGRILREGPFEALWIQPAAGDAGSALGAALDAYHTYFNRPRDLCANGRSRQGGSCWGPSFSHQEITAFLETNGYPYRRLEPDERAEVIARLLEEGKVVGHFAGRVEFGPRALGSRSILGDARNPDMQANLNRKIKYRESFRPFAPSVLAEQVERYFELDRESPYMLLVAPVRQARRLPFVRPSGTDLLPIVRLPRSDIPAVTHVDYSARLQTVTREDHPKYYELIRAFERRTGCATVVNTSFNVRGEPIVCTPHDAYRCFMRTEMDVLVLEDCLLLKEHQPPWPERKGHVEADGDQPGPIQGGGHLLEALRDMYARAFAPTAEELRRQQQLHISVTPQCLPTMWQDYTSDQSPEAIFKIPDALDRRSPDLPQMALAITSSWIPGLATERLRPVLLKLLELGQRFPANEPLDEAVSESIYVMF